MLNEEEFKTASQRLLDAIGGENLVGSGFEEEIPDSELAPPAVAADSGER